MRGGRLDGQGRVDVALRADGLDQAIDESVRTSVTRSHLGENRNGNQESPVEPLFKQLEIRDQQIPTGGQRTDAAAVEQEVSARTAGHSGQVSARC